MTEVEPPESQRSFPIQRLLVEIVGRLRWGGSERKQGGSGMRYRQGDAYADMDPRLQRLLQRSEKGISSPVTSSTGEGEIAVIARVAKIADWEAMSEVRVGATLGATPDGSTVVTGRIPIERVEAVRQHPVVLSLKATQRLRPVLQASTDETNASRERLPAGAQGGGGSGVVVGIVDYGCDFAHQNFRNEDGSTRIEAIWHQGGDPATSQSPFRYGRLYRRAEIDAALKAADPYEALGYGPAPDRANVIGSHGTHVMDIAAGNGRGSQVAGFAPNAEIVFVESATTDVPWEGPATVDAEFGDSTQLLEAIKFIFDTAGDRPCVVNVSLGTNGGPHDGSSLVELGIDAAVRGQANRAVVIAASNSFADGIHTAGTLMDGETHDIGWEIPDADISQNELEIWYPGSDEFGFELLAPDETSMAVVAPGENGELQSEDGRVVLFISHRTGDPNNGDNVVGVFAEADMPAGVWTLRLRGTKVTDGDFHAWIERDDQSQSSFVDQAVVDSYTLGSISCGKESIVVGSYDAHKPGKPISYFSSAGPTRDGRKKPEISGPGHDVLAAHSRTSTEVTAKSGTSMAAPAVTGIVALVLAEARARGIDLAIDRIRAIVEASARANPPTGGAWDGRYGHGRIDAAAAIVQVK
jgi:subtilisin family serine protease